MKKRNSNLQIRERRSILSLVLLMSVPLLHPLTLNAQNSFGNCTEIENSDERLACYDSAMERSSSSTLPVVRLPRSSSEKASQTVAGPQQESSTVSDDQFGLDQNKLTEEESVRVFTVISASRNDFTGWTIEFDNGQVWRQVGTESYRIREGEQYTIRKGFMDSFQLSNSSDNRKLRISRIK